MKPTSRMARAVILFLTAAFVFSLSASLLSAAYVDEIAFRNGQKLIGEIKGLDRGMLTFKTDEMSTISVKWVKVAGLASPGRFRVEAGTGQIVVGSLERASEEGKVVIVTETGKVLLGLDLIVTIAPFEIKLWDRFKGYLNVGFSLQRAQSLTTLNLSTQVSYRTSKWDLTLTGSTYFGKQATVPSTSRNDLSLIVQRDMKGRLFAVGMTEIQQNSELGLSRRLTLGGGIGNNFVWTNHLILAAAVGVIAVDEKYSDAASSTQSAEALLSGKLEAFRYTFPKLNFLITAKIYPSLTDWGRVRVDLDSNLSYEIIRDFSIGLNGFYSVDSRPPTVATPKHDYGITASIRWDFHQ